MKHLNKHLLHTLFGLAGSLAFYIGFISLSNPYKLPLPLLVIPSLLLGFIVYFFIRLVQAGVTSGKSKVVSISISVYAVLLSLLASLQQLSWRDALLAGLLLWLFVFYFKRSKN
jgi:hypothetical protein